MTIARTLEDVMRVTSIRSAVYMAEQECPYDEEFDGNDFSATHLIGYVGNEPAGCLRVRYFADFAKIERLAVRRDFARRASRSDRARRHRTLPYQGVRQLYGHSQKRLLNFWGRFGFQPLEGGKEFYFSDFDYVEIVLDTTPHPKAISIGVDPYIMIRPEGRWHVPGILERSAIRPVTRPSVECARQDCMCTHRLEPSGERLLQHDEGRSACGTPLMRSVHGKPLGLISSQQKGPRMSSVIDLRAYVNPSVIQTLVLVDLQQEYIASPRVLALEETKGALANCRAALAHARAMGLPVAFARWIDRTPLFNKATRFSRWIEGFEPHGVDMIFERNRPSCYASADFAEVMSAGGGSFVLAGFAGEAACLATAIDAFHRGHTVTYLADASASHALDDIAAKEVHRVVARRRRALRRGDHHTGRGSREHHARTIGRAG